jgi:electron transfer flavoprotein beta subunit
MKIVVCVKHVGVLSDEVEFSDEGTAVDPDFLERALNEWDAYAVEEALRIRDAGGGEVVVVTAGDEETEGALRRSLAMGADRAARVDAELDGGDALAPARALAPFVAGEGAALVLCGAQSSDAAYAATPAALAALLDLPCVAVVRKLEIQDGAATATVHRELEGGLVEVAAVDLPAVVSVQTGINAPRYATLRAIRQAEEHEIDVREAPEADPASRIDEMRVPRHAGSTTMLEGGAAEVARQIAAIVKERAG